MKIIKTLFIAAITACTFTVAEAQIHLPPPPPHPGGRPPLPRIHLRTPPPPPRPGGRVVVSSSRSRGSVTVRRHYYYRHGKRYYRTY
ncbi:hypothetical protein [Mucilaginibacter sp. UYCu711]|uniref:hypothetical protein n=1 Tax=Mucilaginibacter sp. UYCu711 TaxID=3156339 RepID=UPI003D190F2E